MNYWIIKWYTYSYTSKCKYIATGNVNAIFQSFISNVPNARRAYDGGQCGQVASKRVRVILAVGAQSFNSTTPRDIRVSVQLAPHQKVSTFRFEHDLEPVQYYILINEGTTDRQFKYCIFISYCEIIFLMQIFFMFPAPILGILGVRTHELCKIIPAKIYGNIHYFHHTGAAVDWGAPGYRRTGASAPFSLPSMVALKR